MRNENAGPNRPFVGLERSSRRQRLFAETVALALAMGLVVGVAMPSTVQAQMAERVLFSFDRTNGGSPRPSPFLDARGNVYGTTISGGSFDFGVIYRVTTSGYEKVLYNFKGGADDGAYPNGLIHDATGSVYGTTSGGGALGVGTVFKIDKTGKNTVLHSFTGFPTDGANPQAGLVRDTSGNLYGTTLNAGAYGYGTVFEVDSNGNESVLYSFTGGVDGAYSYAGLIRDSAGNLYGTTTYGGPYGTGTAGFGTVFMLDSTGKETVLYSFTGGTDGAYPSAALIRDGAGNLYGTTVNGGSGPFSNCGGPPGCGTVFKVDTTGRETVLHNFGNGTDGYQPDGNLIGDSAHNLYGTTFSGGTLRSGTVFKLDATGTESVLYNFGQSIGDGGLPFSGLVRDAAGNLYGTTEGGGAYGYGTVFELAAPGGQ